MITLVGIALSIIVMSSVVSAYMLYKAGKKVVPPILLDLSREREADKRESERSSASDYFRNGVR